MSIFVHSSVSYNYKIMSYNYKFIKNIYIITKSCLKYYIIVFKQILNRSLRVILFLNSENNDSKTHYDLFFMSCRSLFLVIFTSCISNNIKEYTNLKMLGLKKK